MKISQDLLEMIEIDMEYLQEMGNQYNPVEYYLQNLDDIRMRCRGISDRIYENKRNLIFTDDEVEEIVKEVS